MESELFNSAGQKIEKEKADKVKVKYLFDKDRDREVFTEVVVSRVWWALGIPVDRMYPVSVKCKGCEKGEDYPVAALERKFPGKEIETKPDQGWDFKTEITPGYLKAKKTGDPRAVELEALVLAANLVTYHNGANFQNRLSCLEWDKSTGKCSKTIIYISDLGSSLAGPRKPNASMNPRGDFAYWKEQTVFKDAKSCAPRYTLGLPADLKISESARRLMADRLQRLIKDPEQVRMIFRVARMEKADPALAAEIKKKLGTDNLDAKIIEAWSQKLISMANEIISARCPN